MAVHDEEEFTYSALVNRWRRERSASALSKMDGHFYEHFDATLRELRTEYEKEHASNPATPKVLILQDELMNLTRVRDDLYDLRERKIVAAAVIAARGGNPDRGHMTKEEDLLFEELLRTMRDARRNLLRRGQPKDAPVAKVSDIGAPHRGPPTPPEPAPEPRALAQPAATLDERAPVAEASPEAPLPGAPQPAPMPPARATEEVVATEAEREPRRLGPARVLVRVKQPVPPFVGTDLRTYRLSVEDIAAVPKEMAHALVSRGLAVALGA
ncbi:MAG TPA: hypothetical protein VM370_12865 [Candidatus Thermoplasmatota archaeon]|nr:hypothetical protein [Candidatus Thermoplasmatota archaeon]